jgi:hypothetical protein
MSKNILKLTIQVIVLFSLVNSWRLVADAREVRSLVIQARDWKTKKDRYRVHTTLWPIPDKPNAWILNSRGEGRFHIYDNVNWQSTTELLVQDGHLLPVLAQWDIYQKNNLVERWTHSYDFLKGKIKFSLTMPLEGVHKNFVFPIKGLTTDYTSLALFLEAVVPAVNSDQQYSFYLLTSEPRLYRVNMKYIKEEELRLPSGARQAIKFRLVADMGFLDDMLDRFVSPTFIWYDAAPPHHWLKYQGMETGEGSTVIEAEVVEDSLVGSQRDSSH